MLERGQRELERLRPGAAQQLGFHLPPFVLVNHLHLHCLALPKTSWLRGWLFAPAAPWWVDAAAALQQLRP